MTSITHTMGNLTVSTLDNRRKSLTDNIFDFCAFFYYLKTKGKLKMQTGGEYAEFPIMIAKNETVSYVDKGGTVSLADTDFLDLARYEWATIAVNVVNYFKEARVNRGKGRILNLINKKLDNAIMSVADQLEESLADNPPSGSPVLTAITDFVKSTSATSGTTGGVTRNSTTWFNQTKAGTSRDPSVYLLKDLRTLMNDCSIVGQASHRIPDLLLSGQDEYEYYEDELVEVNIVTNKAISDLGFGGGLKFKGATWVWSPAFDGKYTIYVLNSNNIGIVVDPIANLRMTPWKDIPNQPFDQVAQIVSVLQLGCDCLRNQGVYYDVAQ